MLIIKQSKQKFIFWGETNLSTLLVFILKNIILDCLFVIINYSLQIPQ